MEKMMIRRPDDLHVHLRDGDMLKAVLPLTARQFSRAIVMPNLVPPVTSTEMAEAYRQRTMKSLPKESKFQPLMTLYLTDNVDINDLRHGFEKKVFVAGKLYPVGATTNSDAGVTSIANIYKALEVMQEIGMPLCVYGETVVWNRKKVDPYDRENVFLVEELDPLLGKFRGLKVVLEHVTTEEGVRLVEEKDDEHFAATVTAHHLWASRTDVFEGGMSADMCCLPTIKREEDRRALRRAATSGNPRFFLGTDSAPHLASKKYAHRSPGGIFTAHAAIEMYTQIFEDEGALENLEAFASLNGAQFYGLPVNDEFITLQRKDWKVDKVLKVGDDYVYPFLYEEDPAKRQVLRWQISKK